MSQQFNEQYPPVKALLIYLSAEQESENYEQKPTEMYVESYDIGKQGNPINTHPLSLKEICTLSELTQSTQELQKNYLPCRGVTPPNLIYTNYQNNGYAVWYTSAQETGLFFTYSLVSYPAKPKSPQSFGKGPNNAYKCLRSKKNNI